MRGKGTRINGDRIWRSQDAVVKLHPTLALPREHNSLLQFTVREQLFRSVTAESFYSHPLLFWFLFQGKSVWFQLADIVHNHTYCPHTHFWKEMDETSWTWPWIGWIASFLLTLALLELDHLFPTNLQRDCLFLGFQEGELGLNKSATSAVVRKNITKRILFEGQWLEKWRISRWVLVWGQEFFQMR